MKEENLTIIDTQDHPSWFLFKLLNQGGKLMVGRFFIVFDKDETDDKMFKVRVGMAPLDVKFHWSYQYDKKVKKKESKLPEVKNEGEVVL